MWLVTENSFDPKTQHHKETIFTIGNGYLCSRGVFEEGYPGERRATFVHGVFDNAPIVVTELANAPDWLPMYVLLNGERFSLTSGSILEYQRSLDLRSGVLTRRVRWRSPSGWVATFHFERFASLADEHLLCQRCQIIPEFDGVIEIRAALNGNADNQGLAHWHHLAQGQDAEVVYLRSRTRTSQIEMALAMRLQSSPLVGSEYWDAETVPTVRKVFQVQAGQTVTVTKLIGVATSRDAECPLDLAREHVLHAESWEACLEAHRRAWEEEWKRCEVSIEGDEEAELAVRFSLYHLLIAASRHDPRVNIGAKTLSGFGYRGHAFWDTEIFMLPVFIYTAPHIARNLLDYRYLTLPAAREKARRAGYEGAWFAWESADTGEEVTPTWIPDFHDSKKLARVWTGDLAIHISADVAYGAHHYWRVTGDDAWFAERGVELILEAARFFVSRAEWDEKRQGYGYRNVIGPDEYHDHVNNNAYTNLLAQWTIQTGLQVLGWLDTHYPLRATDLRQQLNLTPERLRHWQQVAEKILVSQRSDGLIEQFDGYFDLQDVNLEDYEPRTRSMHEIFGIEAANYYQVIKQPDVLMLLYLLRDRYSDSQIQVNYDYYTPRTDHTYGSSLGPSIQAILAAVTGHMEDAYRHFLLAARADLRDVRGNAGDGIHAASAGGIWQAVVFGFCGLHVDEHGWTVAPRLPAHWKRVTFRFLYRDTLQQVEVTHLSAGHSRLD